MWYFFDREIKKIRVNNIVLMNESEIGPQIYSDIWVYALG